MNEFEEEEKPKQIQIYVPGNKVNIVVRAKELFDESLSALILNSLECSVREKEAELLELEEQTISIGSWPPSYGKYETKNSKKRFIGKIICQNTGMPCAGTSVFPVDLTVYVTKGGNYLIYYRISFKYTDDIEYALADYIVLDHLINKKGLVRKKAICLNWHNVTSPAFNISPVEGMTEMMTFPDKIEMPEAFQQELLNVLHFEEIEVLDI